MSNNELKKIALDLRNEFNNIYNLIKEKNIVVMYYDLNNITPALTKKILGENVIIIDNNLSEDEADFVLSHEVAHILFHDNSIRLFSKINSNYDKYELQANIFATIFTNYSYSNFNSNNYIQKIVNNIYINHLSS